MASVRDFLAGLGLPKGDLNELPDSAKRFPDGAEDRIEIPSTEGPRCLEAVLDEAELIRVAAPVYVKFGLRNAPDVYPAGTHLEATTVALSRERVRRARLGLELLARSGYEPTTSELGAAGLAIPALTAA
jgi:hypothetical protein